MAKIKVAIFAGHGKGDDGKWDPGCCYGKDTEAKLVLPITQAVVKYLRSTGKFSVYTDSKNQYNANVQIKTANKNKVKMFMSIHCDYSGAPTGTLPLYVSDAGKKIANAVNKAVLASGTIGTRGLCKRTDLKELNATDMPAVIFETGSIKADNKVLKNPDAYGKAIAKGICDYYGVAFAAKKKEKKVVVLTNKNKQIMLQRLGLYCGLIDGSRGPLQKAAEAAFKKKYGVFNNAKLKEVYAKRNKTKLSAHFKLSEFKCPRYCNGYPKTVSPKLIGILEKLRTKYGKPIIITSGMRCKKYNDSLKGSSKTSKHLSGKAADIYIPGASLADIKKTAYSYGAKYVYYGTSNMGNCIHINK